MAYTADIVNLKNRTPQGVVGNAKTADESASVSREILWEAPEYEIREKSAGWHIAVYALAGILVVVMLLVKNYTAAVFFGVAAVVVSLYAGREPRRMRFSISGKGVEVAGRLYPYESLRSFWIFYESEAKRAELSIRSRKALMPYVRLPLGDTNPAKVHALLSKFIPEVRHADSAADALARRAGF